MTTGSSAVLRASFPWTPPSAGERRAGTVGSVTKLRLPLGRCENPQLERGSPHTARIIPQVKARPGRTGPGTRRHTETESLYRAGLAKTPWKGHCRPTTSRRCPGLKQGSAQGICLTHHSDHSAPWPSDPRVKNLNLHSNTTGEGSAPSRSALP